MFWGHQSPGRSVLSKGWNRGGKDWKEIHQNSIGRFVWMVAPILVCSFSSDFANFLSSSPCKIEMSEINCRWMTGRWKESFLSSQTLSSPAALRHAHQDTRPQSPLPGRSPLLHISSRGSQSTFTSSKIIPGLLQWSRG